MLTTKEKEHREEIEAKIKRLKYLLYQAEIQFVSHDSKLMKKTIRKISQFSKSITDSFCGKLKKNMDKKVNKRLVKK